MAGETVLKRSDMKDGDWIFLHREPQGLGSPRVEGGSKKFAMTARDFHSVVLSSPVSDTDAANAGVENLLMRPVGFRAGQPVVADVNRILESVVMAVGAYTLDNTTPLAGIALNVTVTVTQDTQDDTEGTLDIVGTDIDDQVLTETITPLIGSTISGLRAFKTITSVTSVGWITGGNDDTIEVGFGELIGLPDYLLHDTVLFVLFNNVREGTHPTVTSSTTVLALNTVDLNSGLDGSVVVIYYLAGKWI